MPTFQYIARDSSGAESIGSIEALTSVDAYNQLRRRGLRIHRIENADALRASAEAATRADSLDASVQLAVPGGNGIRSAATPGSAANPGAAAPFWTAAPPLPAGEDESAPDNDLRLGSEALAEIAGRIAGITRSQLPLAPGLRALSEELPSRSLRRGLRVLCDRVERGESLEEALKSPGTAIPPHIAGLIIGGVRSGRLGEIMEWFLKHVRRQIDLRRRCRASLFYPIVLLLAALAALTFGLTWIVPDIRHLYSDFNMELPVATIGLIAASDAARTYGLYLLAAIVLPLAALPVFVHWLGGKPLRDRLLAGAPFVGTMFRSSALAAFCELLTMFIAGRLGLAEAVRLAGEGCGDADLQVQFDSLSDCLEQGQDDPELFRRLANISPHLIHVFHWKNREATFVEALLSAVRIYENQAQMQIALGAMFLEPIVIVGVLGGAGFFIVLLFWPLIRLLNSLS